MMSIGCRGCDESAGDKIRWFDRWGSVVFKTVKDLPMALLDVLKHG